MERRAAGEGQRQGVRLMQGEDLGHDLPEKRGLRFAPALLAVSREKYMWGMSRYQGLVFFAAWLGWGFDVHRRDAAAAGRAGQRGSPSRRCAMMFA